MTPISLTDFVVVPIPLRLYRELLDRHADRAHAVIEDVVADFLERTVDDMPRYKRNRGAGVHWEALFLPDKTRLRTKHYGEYKHADVRGDAVMFDGEAFPSVSKATNRMRGDTSNNAWNVLEVLRPDDSQWVRADILRRRGGL